MKILILFLLLTNQSYAGNDPLPKDLALSLIDKECGKDMKFSHEDQRKLVYKFKINCGIKFFALIVRTVNPRESIHNPQMQVSLYDMRKKVKINDTSEKDQKDIIKKLWSKFKESDQWKRESIAFSKLTKNNKDSRTKENKQIYDKLNKEILSP